MTRIFLCSVNRYARRNSGHQKYLRCFDIKYNLLASLYCNYKSPNYEVYCFTKCFFPFHFSKFSFVEVLREGDSKDTGDAAEPCHPGGFYACIAEYVLIGCRKYLHPGKLTWTLKIGGLEEEFPFNYDYVDVWCPCYFSGVYLKNVTALVYVRLFFCASLL